MVMSEELFNKEYPYTKGYALFDIEGVERKLETAKVQQNAFVLVTPQELSILIGAYKNLNYQKERGNANKG